MTVSVPDEVADSLAPTGAIRAAINFGNPVLAQQDPATGAAGGVSVDLATELSQRTGIPLRIITFDAAGKVFASISSGLWDIAFLAIDPARAAEILFTPPYVIIEGTYMVRDDSPLRSVDEADRLGIRVAVANKSAYDLYLTRTLKHAEIVRAPTGGDAIAQFLRHGLEVVAGVKGPLVRYARHNPGLRVMDGRFMIIEQAMGTLKGREPAWRYLCEFIEQMKAGGLVLRSLERSGQSDALVAPPAAQQRRAPDVA